MCGIAGYSLREGTTIDPSLLTTILLAGLAERGEDACGFGYRDADGQFHVIKRAMPPHQFLSTVSCDIPSDIQYGFVHVRDHTKGRPTHDGNNHPIKHGNVCGVHNGIIQNDDELFVQMQRNRALPGMSVDSEAIFMLFDVLETYHDAFAHLIGSYSVAFTDDRIPNALFAARGKGRPLLLAEGDGIAMVASTRHAIHFAENKLGLRLQTRTVAPGSLLTMINGEVRSIERFVVTPFEETRTVAYSKTAPQAEAARKLANDYIDQARSS